MIRHWSKDNGERRRAVRFPGPTVLADRKDRFGPSVDDGGVATAGVMGAVRRHGADLFAVGDLVQQLWQNGAVTIAAGGELHRPDVFLLGHSYGAHVALGAAALVPDLVRKLVLYGPPWPHLADAQIRARLEAMAGVGDRDGDAATFLSEVYEIRGAVLDAFRGTEDWETVLEDGPATLRDLRALARFDFDPALCSALSIPVLLQIGTETPSVSVTDALAAVLPDVEIGKLAGQAHEAMTTAPEQHAEAARRFLMV